MQSNNLKNSFARFNHSPAPTVKGLMSDNDDFGKSGDVLSTLTAAAGRLSIAAAICLTPTAAICLAPAAAMAEQKPAPPQKAPPAPPSSTAAPSTAAPSTAPVPATPAPAVSAPAPQSAEQPNSNNPLKLNASAPAWTVTCVSSGRTLPANCVMEQRLFAKETGRLLSVAAVSVPGVARQPVLWLQLPTGLALRESVTLTVDKESPRSLAVQSCDERSCAISLPIAPDLLAALKKGVVMTVKAVSANGEPLTFPHMLNDFAASYEAVQ